MSSKPFYTSVEISRSKVLCRGVKDGERFNKSFRFKPTLFIENQGNQPDQQSGWKSIHGNPVEPMKFDSFYEANQFIEQYRGVQGIRIHGMNEWKNQFVAEAFGNDEIEFDISKINITAYDIEVASDEGFPEPSEALHPIISIALWNNQQDLFYVWGLDDFDKHNMQEIKDIDPGQIVYRQFDSESNMLMDFISWWRQPENTPDVLTGWNSKLFDTVYVVNRIRTLFGPEFAAKLSPFGEVRRKDVQMQTKEVMAYHVVGIEQLDYLDLFKKFGLAYGEQENNRLDTIANVVLGERKLDYSEFGNLHTLYKQNHQLFIEYNIRDTDLIRRFDDKLAFIELAMTIAYKAGCNYSDAFGTTRVWDAYIYRYLNQHKIAPPIVTPGEKMKVGGGHVKPPVPGRHDWVVSFDLNSLYPHLMMQYNISPDTIINDVQPGISPDSVLNGAVNASPEEYSMTATGQLFQKNFQGVMPALVQGLYDERKEVKKDMLKYKQELEQVDKDSDSYKRLDREIARLDNRQMAVKILMNSCYGATANRFFRYFDPRIADCITASGRLSIRWAESAVNAFMNKVMETSDVDYVIAIDTDSLYISVASLVKKYKLDQKDRDEITKVLDKICQEQFEKVIAEAYQNLADTMGAYQNKMVMGREVIAERGIWVAKKRYILSVLNNEGVQYSEPKLKVMGIEAIKSSTPEVCRDKFQDAFKILISGSEDELHRFVSDFKQEFKQLPIEAISAPRGITAITKWTRRQPDGQHLAIKGTPYHVRGAIAYNNAIKQHKLTNRYPVVQDGEKIKFCALKSPNIIGANVISYPEAFPRELGQDEGVPLADAIDYNSQFAKVFGDSLDIILEAIGWTAEPRSTLDALFG